MIQWCSYCQRYQGESPPFDNYVITHGICDRCMDGERFLDAAAVEQSRPLVAFFARLREEALTGSAVRADALLAEAEELGVRPLDFLVGMLQPVLCELGDLWAAGRISIATEHQFTRLSTSVASAVRQKLLASLPPRASSRPDVLLVAADGNSHTLGLEIVEVQLLSAGYAAHLVIPGLPAQEVASLVRSLKPKILAVSACLDAHVTGLGELAPLLDEVGERPRLLVGGHAIRRGRMPDAAVGFEPCLDARKITDAREHFSPQRLPP